MLFSKIRSSLLPQFRYITLQTFIPRFCNLPILSGARQFELRQIMVHFITQISVYLSLNKTASSTKAVLNNSLFPDFVNNDNHLEFIAFMSIKQFSFKNNYFIS